MGVVMEQGFYCMWLAGCDFGVSLQVHDNRPGFIQVSWAEFGGPIPSIPIFEWLEGNDRIWLSLSLVQAYWEIDQPQVHAFD